MSRRIIKAMTLATQLHAGQVDKQAQPYILHLLDVAERVSIVTDNETAVVVALLHDILEDTNLMPSELDFRFGPSVAKAVSLLTRDPRMSYEDFISRIADGDNEVAKIVKVADLKSNLERIPTDYSLKQALMWKRLHDRYTASLTRLA